MMKFQKHMKSINKIFSDKVFVQLSKPDVEVIIKKDGKVIYRNKAVAGVMNFVERVDNMDKKAFEIEGQTQNFCFGHPALQLFSFDQLKQNINKVINTDLIKTLEAFDHWISNEKKAKD